MIHNYEFKARTDHLDELEAKLKTLNPHYVGEDHQIDTYFNVTEGRLKLRQGNIENSLIRYHRENAADSKLSQVLLYKHQPAPELKTILESSLGVDVVVDKLRKIYFIDHVKFHFDRVQGLGTFIEVEIDGRLIPGATLVPERSVSEDRTVWVVEADKLAAREPQLLFQENGFVVTEFFDFADGIVTSPLLDPLAGSAVTIVGTAKAETNE